jgi:hypothetical protein
VRDRGFAVKVGGFAVRFWPKWLCCRFDVVLLSAIVEGSVDENKGLS